MELKKKSRMEKQRMLQTDRHIRGFREGVGEAGNVFRDRSFSPAFSFRRHFQRLWKSRERLKDVIWRDPMPKGDIPATDKQLWNLKHIFPVFTYSVEKRILLLMLKCALHTIHILLSLMLFLDEFLVALLYLIHAVHHCWKMFASWAGSLSGVALDGLRTELEWRSLLPAVRKESTGGESKPRSSTVSSSFSLYWGWNIFPFLHSYCNSYQTVDIHLYLITSLQRVVPVPYHAQCKDRVQLIWYFK